MVPVQTRHPVPMAQQALTTQSACDGRFTLGIGSVARVDHRWSVGPVVRASGSLDARLPPGAQRRIHRAGARRRQERHLPRTQPDGCRRTHADARVLAALGPVMLQIAGEQTSGTILWMADERAIHDHIAPRIARAATAAGRPAPRIVAGVPVALCSNNAVDDARAYSSEELGHAHFSPNYERLLQHGDATDVGDTMAAGDEQAVLRRLLRYRDAGVTDLAVRIVPLGADSA